jgi:hypothetical protein
MRWSEAGRRFEHGTIRSGVENQVVTLAETREIGFAKKKGGSESSISGVEDRSSSHAWDLVFLDCSSQQFLVELRCLAVIGSHQTEPRKTPDFVG